ncbi:uncharacterized protein LOC144132966 [Amblyomma americanum]
MLHSVTADQIKDNGPGLAATDCWSTGKWPMSRTMAADQTEMENCRGEDRGGRLHQCTHCSRSFKHRTNLVRHLHNHSSSRPHRCDYCESAFTRRDVLVKHLRTHTLHITEKPYCCHLCPMQFARHEGLLRHARSHEGGRLH